MSSAEVTTEATKVTTDKDEDNTGSNNSGEIMRIAQFFRLLRIIKLFRIIRIFKLARHIGALKALGKTCNTYLTINCILCDVTVLISQEQLPRAGDVVPLPLHGSPHILLAGLRL